MALDSAIQQTTTADEQAPNISSGSIATNDQDASTGLAAASVQARIEDSGSGLAWGRLTYTSAQAPDQRTDIYINERNLVDGDNNSGSYTSSSTFHENAASGTWNLTEAEFRDKTGNLSYLYDTDLSGWLTDQGLTSLASFSLTSSNPDITDPILGQIILGSAIQDSATGTFYIPVSVQASDNLSGIRNGSLRIAEANSGQSAYVWFGDYDGSGSGTAADPFKTSFILSEYAANGIWSLTDAWLYDEAGNHINLWDTTLSSFLSTTSSTGSVVISNANEDITDPVLQGISLVTSTTDDATGRALITLDVPIHEQNAGFDYGWIYFSEINGGGSFDTYINDTNLISDSLHVSADSYRISVLAPEGYSDGDWQISRVYLRDRAGNWWDSSEAGDTLLQLLRQAGSIDNFTLAPAVAGIPYQEYLSDIEAPEIDGASFRLNYVPDSRTGEGGRLFIEFRAWDDVSGVNNISLSFTSSSGQTYNYDIDNAHAYLDLRNLSAEHNPIDEELRGDTLNGWFRGSIGINEYAPSGEWMLSSVYITDRAGNSTSIYEDRSYSGNGYFGDSPSTNGFVEWGFDPADLSFTVSNTTPDNQAPDFSALSLASNIITNNDLDQNGQARLPFVINIQDNISGSGIQRVELQYKGPNGTWAYGSIYTDALNNGSLTSGDSRSGIFNGSIWVSAYNGSLQTGNYDLASISIIDRAGNFTTYRDEALTGGGYFDSTSAVVSNGSISLSDKLTMLGLNSGELNFTYSATTANNPNPDTAAPEISAIQIWPYQINKPAGIGLGDQQNALPIRISATDASGIGNISLTFRNTLYGDSWSTDLYLSDQNMTQGSTIRDGNFEGSIILNEYAQEGRWILSGMYINDVAGNYQSFWNLHDITESGALTQEALDQRAALAALDLNIDDLSFVAGDFVEPKAKSVMSGSQISFDVYGMNQQASTKLYWTANVNGKSTTPVAITLDSLKTGTFTLDTSSLGSFLSDQKVFIDLWQDINRFERVGEAASFILKAPVIASDGGGISSPSTPAAPIAAPPVQQPTAPPVAAQPLPETAVKILEEIFVNQKAAPTTAQWTELASNLTNQLPDLVAAGRLTETSAGVLESLANGSMVDEATQTSSKGIPVKAGGDSDDVITGNAGKGVLVGGAGADAFAFIEQDRFGKRGTDRITDFNPDEGDKIVISPASFPGLENFKFASISGRDGLRKALRGEATIIYIEETGELYYNSTPGKSGKGAGGLFAVLNDRPQIRADSFDILNPSTLLG